ncbi:helix-turn-helix domain-containing protein [Bacillus paranthracis]|uniref:helix-turn-helix transcriptional regulator n=1 Tax=Bacillus paranthracis TaxID=2026186 RepID=UPI00148EEF0B|nr:helix-turn-helix domain-containing protein [Bacillus paranthracis]NOP79585.1 helix-turn-helix domain-containing protein [Bacillus paranthracis]
MKMTAEDILKAIEEMDNPEKGNLLRRLKDKYFDNSKWEQQKWDSLYRCIQDSATLIEKFPDLPEGAVNYSITEIAEIFGVSEQKINDWIKNGRFIRLEKDETSQPVRISANSIWIARNGNMHYVSEFVKEWKKEKSTTESSGNEYKALFEFVKFFENKYGGDFKTTLGTKAIRDMTAEEESDTSMWQYCLKTIEGYINKIALERKEDVANIPLRIEIDN